ncbi:MAG: endonuclease [Paludibacteraceae bacterium]
MKLYYWIVTILFIPLSLQAQVEKRNFKIVSYNVENYFDVVDDSLKADEEYLPGGMRGWNESKYYAKQANISKVIAAIGGWQPPALVALCEIESDQAMRGLTRMSPLKNLDYHYIQYESPDARGIDVALMYQRDQFKPFHSEPIPIAFSNTSYKTRDILYVAGTVLATDDTLHVFVCHWPSRLGGELESEDRRLQVAEHLRHKTDSIFRTIEKPNIVIMGDFNDYPSNTSILNTLGANPLNEEFATDKLYNLAFRLEEQGKGSHKFQGEWGMLDQIIVSGNLLNPQNSISTTVNDMHVFDADFLLEDDKAFLGKMPKRTYIGMRYQGGFADHLPVCVDMWY